MLAAHLSTLQRFPARMNRRTRCACALIAVVATVMVGCASPPTASDASIAPAVAPSVPPAPVAAAPPVEPPPPLPPAPVAPALPAANVPKETPPPIELPSYAKRGKRLPADGGPPGRVVLSYCRTFEIDKDAVTYFKRLQKQNRLPTEIEVAGRNRQNDQSLTVQQFVERDWALRRDNNKSVPQKCKVLGGSSEGVTALVVFEADLNGRRQRGTATVLLTNGKWTLRDHGDWSPVR